ncbi:hypothetical protein EVAR_81451_1 [Eumeta japonica]|uniref:Uncharacterized protein n=1 Tax=Eumeta variegata TaxID=151549 RepID=A0A4C1VZV2_EUMVA|nr:hypothetical protein EVAR_81451_1 [Eumeta japonica]
MLHSSHSLARSHVYLGFTFTPEALCLLPILGRWEKDIARIFAYEPILARQWLTHIVNARHTFNSDPIPTLVFNSSPVLNFCPSSATDSDPSPVVDSALCLDFNSDSTSSHSSFEQSRKKC